MRIRAQRTRHAWPIVRVVVTLIALSAGGRAQEVVLLGEGDLTTEVHVPSVVDEGDPLPLVVNLHGYGGSRAYLEPWLGFRALTETYGFIYALPNGSVAPNGARYWRATDLCCGPRQPAVDHAGHLLSVVEEIASRYSVDTNRIYFMGHSNGGFMSYRMACDHADLVAAIVSIAGATYRDESLCEPSVPVHVLQVHGVADLVVPYEGQNPDGFPGALHSVQQWARFNGCSSEREELEAQFDFVFDAEPETRVTRFACDDRGSSELWSVEGAGHNPGWSADGVSTRFARAVMDWLLAHPKQPVSTECPWGLWALRSEGASVRLSWQNGSSPPRGVDVYRNGDLIAQGAPADPAEFVDRPETRGVQRYRLVFDVDGSECRELVAGVDNTPECDTHCVGLTAEPIDGDLANLRVVAESLDDAGDPVFYTLTVRERLSIVQRVGPQSEGTFEVLLGPGEWTLSVTVDDGLSCRPNAPDSSCSMRWLVPEGLYFFRGDVNADDLADISDAVRALDWLFLGAAEPSCLASANVNGDGAVDIGDPTYLLNHLFLGGPPPPAPFGDCGESELEQDLALGCAESPCS